MPVAHRSALIYHGMDTIDWKDESRSALLRAAHEAKQQAAATAATATTDAAATEVTDSSF
jgi:hypothetical protein